jgi:hypothetical protein
MIDHKNKTIFIHIPRCGGTSIEKALTGFDYWNINPTLKHAPANIYKNLFPNYWDEYFKFSIIRDPYTRFRSLWKHRKEYGLNLDADGKICIEKYVDYFGPNKIIESQENLKNSGLELKYTDTDKFGQNQVYGNYINEKIDRIYYFEDLPKVFSHLSKIFNIQLLTVHAEKSQDPPPELSKKSISLINDFCSNDFDRFGYTKINYDTSNH